MKAGRPLRFLALWLGGWAAARTMLLWPAAQTVEALIRAVASPAAAATVLLAVAEEPVPPLAMASPASVLPAPRATPLPVIVVLPQSPPTPDRKPPKEAAAVLIRPPPWTPTASGQSRLALSGWAMVRGGGQQDSSSGQLGASQAGMRATYSLDRTRRVAAAARISAPSRGRGKELALGLDWQPGTAPVHLIVEHRIALDGGRGGTTALVVGGFGPTEILRGVRVEGYAQAGAIARRPVDGFADGAVRVNHALGRIGAAHLDIGGGSWGGAQRGAARLDIGPSIGIAAPVGGKLVRLTLDWRERVAGNARPGSAPALSIGSDF